MWRGPNRTTATTAIFVASALCGGTSVEKVRRFDEYRVGNTLSRIRDTSSSSVTTSSTFHDQAIPARDSFPHQLNGCRIGHCNLLPDLNSNR